jgi:hypothetical protein
MALMSLLSYRFLLPPSYYKWLRKLKDNGIGVTFHDIYFCQVTWKTASFVKSKYWKQRDIHIYTHIHTQTAWSQKRTLFLTREEWAEITRRSVVLHLLCRRYQILPLFRPILFPDDTVRPEPSIPKQFITLMSITFISFRVYLTFMIWYSL